ncbi:hypothetical protein GCM10022625_22930 [Deinococcus aetherius]
MALLFAVLTKVGPVPETLLKEENDSVRPPTISDKTAAFLLKLFGVLAVITLIMALLWPGGREYAWAVLQALLAGAIATVAWWMWGGPSI